MRKFTKTRLPLLVPLVAAAAFSLSACGHFTVTASGSGTDSGGNSTTGVASTPAVSAGSGGLTSSSSGTPGAGTTGAAQFGTAGTTSGNSGSGSGGQVGVTGGGSGAGTAAIGMSPDAVANFCKVDSGNNMANPDYIVFPSTFGDQVLHLKDLKNASPVQYAQNIDILISDYQAVANQARIYSEVRDEIHNNWKPIDQLHQQICQS